MIMTQINSDLNETIPDRIVGKKRTGGMGGYPLLLLDHVTKSIQMYKRQRPLLSQSYSIMNQLRCSRRLRGLRPEIPNPSFRCFCLREGDACLGGAITLSCCRQCLHSSCFQQWRRTHSTCPLCRSENPTSAIQLQREERPIQLQREEQPRRPNLESMSIAEVVARLEGLLDMDVLQRELEQVSSMFLCIEPLGVQKAIFIICTLVANNEIDLYHCLELDVDCTTFTESEKQTISSLYNIITRSTLQTSIVTTFLRPVGRNSNINFVNEHRTHIVPPRYLLERAFDYDEQRILFELHFMRVNEEFLRNGGEATRQLVFSIRLHRYRPHFI